MLVKSLALVIAALAFACPTATSQSMPKTQPTLDYEFSSAISLGSNIGDHVFQKNVRFSGFAALNDDGIVAFSGEWIGSAIGAGRSKGVYTSNRVVAEEGDKLGKNILVQVTNVRPGDLQLNSQGRVAYLASINGPACGAASTCTALMIEHEIKAVTNVPNPSYLLTDDGKIEASPAAGWIAPLAEGSGVGGRLLETLPPIKTPTKVIHLPCPGCDFTIPSTVIPLGKKAKAAAGPQSANFSTPTAYPNCPTPAGYKFPFLWPEKGNGAGPIGSASGQVYWGQVYAPVGQNGRGNWVRKGFFSTDCRAILVSVVQPGGPTAEELWTPVGLLASFDSANGVYHFGAAGDALMPQSNKPIEDGIRINRRCAAMIPVTLRGQAGPESALILATPTNPGSCQ